MNSMSRELIAVVTIVLVLLMAGCSAHPKRVDCDAQLRPINAPAPVAHASGTSP